MAYIKRIGNKHRLDAMKDKRLYDVYDDGGVLQLNTDGSAKTIMRNAQNWQEVHHILVEFEGDDSSSKALVGALAPPTPPQDG